MWAEIHSTMRGRFVKLLNHDMNITEDVGPVMSIDQNVENVFPQELALMKLLNVAAEQSASFHASDSVLHGGEFAALARQTTAFQNREHTGREIGLDRSPVLKFRSLSRTFRNTYYRKY